MSASAVEALHFAKLVTQEAARLLDIGPDEVIAHQGAPTAMFAALDAGENACDVARQLVDDGVLA